MDEAPYTGIFLEFFYLLRSRGLKVTPDQWLSLVRAMSMGLHGSSLMGFYSLSRGILVRDESELDDFDMCFAKHFQGVDIPIKEIEEDVFNWLREPIAPYEVDPELRKVLDAVDVDKLREEFEKRLEEQKTRHNGGSKWVGTGGTSPFGHSGYHPGGIRVGGQGRLGSAVQVAAARRYKEHRKDVVLDTRQLSVALKKLRALKREGPAEELDLERTISQTARQGGELELVFQAPRENNMELLLAMDVGGSMEPYRRLVDLLFSAAHGARHFKRFKHVYFHNCIYDSVYFDSQFNEPLALHELMKMFGRDVRLVLVGDAHMYPGELLDPGGSIHWWDRNPEPGVSYLRKLREHFRYCAWLNPMTERFWNSPSVTIVSQVFDMLPLTIEGVEQLAVELSKGT